MQTKLTWDDLVIPINLRQQLEEMVTWVKHEGVVLNEWGLGNRLKPGYRALFHGPPGTGKTLSAALLGKRLGRTVYRVNLSQTISKYIGETEKSLSQLFHQAENKNWILFFDEADALFGKRTTVQGASPRYANQEVSYLLQRIENQSGLVILASSIKDNLDGAFSRRFQATLHFPMPDAKQRLQLWQQTIGTAFSLAGDVDLKQLATDYELTGGSILNLVRYCATAALQRGDKTVQQKDLLTGIRRELQKQGKTS